jgi:hypothetical protein
MDSSIHPDSAMTRCAETFGSGQSRSELRMRPEFSCPQCHSSSVKYPDILNDSAPVLCGRCGVTLGTIGDLRRMAELFLADTGFVSRRIP